MEARCVMLEMTPERRMEAALREHDRQSRELLGGLPVAVYTTDAAGRITYFNEAAAELWGHRPELGKSEWCGSWRLYWPDGRPMPHDQCPMALALKENRAIKAAEAAAERPDGTRVAFLAFPAPLRDASGGVVGAVNTLVDIAGHKQTEALLAGQKRVLETLATGATLTDVLAAVVGLLEEQSEGLFGSILVRRPHGCRFHTAVAPSLPASYAEALGQAPISPPYLGPCGRATHLGEEVVAVDIAADSRWLEQWRDLALGLGLGACYSIPILASDGTVLGSFGMYRRDPNVNPKPPSRQLLETATHLAGIAIERKQAEQALHERETNLRALSQSLERRVEERTAKLRRMTAKLASAEQRERKWLAALLHDDLQQWLVAAKMRLGRIRGRALDPEAALEIEGAARLLGQAMSSSRDLTRRLRPPGLYEGGLVPALRWLAAELSKLHGLHVVIDAQDAEPALGDDVNAMLFEAVRELLFNVVKHAGVSEAAVVVRQDGQGLQIAVEDQGGGFDVDAVEQRLKQDARAQGVGLFSIRERIAALGGKMIVESTTAGGTCVRLTVTSVAAGVAGAASSGRPAGRSGATHSQTADAGATERRARVLVVDDHTIVRQAVATMLSGDQRLVVVGEAADGVEAIEAVERHQPDVVLIDVNMPRMNGIEATREICRRWPDVRVVALSIQDDETVVKSMIAAGAAGFVSKSDDAERMIRAVLAPLA